MADWRVNAGNDFVPDAAGAIERGRSLADMETQRQNRNYTVARQRTADVKADALEEAEKSLYQMGADGKAEINPSGVQKVFAVDPRAAYAKQQELEQTKLKSQMAQIEQYNKLNKNAMEMAGGVYDQRSYDMFLSNAGKFGVPGLDRLPKVYDKDLMASLQGQAMDFDKQLEQKRKDAEFRLKELDQRLGARKTEADIAKTDAERRKIIAEAGGGGSNGTGGGQVPAFYAKKGAEEKQKIGMIADAFRSITGYEDAYKGGARPQYMDDQTPIIGRAMSSTPISEATVKLTDDIGRLRSGGAIGQQEEERFLSMLPRPGDNEAAAKRKIAALRSEFKNKLAGFGVQTSDLQSIGFDTSTMGLDRFETAKTAPPPPAGVQMMAPDGTIRVVPKESVQAAMQAGGKLVEGAASR